MTCVIKKGGRYFNACPFFLTCQKRGQDGRTIRLALPGATKGGGGPWDKFIGPGATRSEQAIAIVPAIVSAGVITYHAYAVNLGWSAAQYIVAAFLVFDIIGGVVTNATTSAKRWYHRQGQTALRHLWFIPVLFVKLLISYLTLGELYV